MWDAIMHCWHQCVHGARGATTTGAACARGGGGALRGGTARPHRTGVTWSWHCVVVARRTRTMVPAAAVGARQRLALLVPVLLCVLCTRICSYSPAAAVHLRPNCSLHAPGVVDGVQTACACQSKDGKNTPMPCGPSEGFGYAASDQCMPQVCHKILVGNMKGHCHNELCPTCGSGVIRGPGASRFHLRDNSCGNNDPNAQFYDPVHKLYHTFFQDHLGIPQYQGPRNRSDPTDTGSWTGGVVYGHLVSRDFAHWAHLPVALWNAGSFKTGRSFTDDASNSGGIFTGSTTMINGGRDPIMVTPGRGYDVAVPLNRSDPLLTDWTRPCYHNPQNASSFLPGCINPIAHEGTSDDPCTAWQTPHGEWRLIGNNPHSGNNHPGFFAPIYAAKAFTETDANFTYLGNSSFPGGECPSLFPLPPLAPGSQDPKELQGMQGVPGWPPTHVHKVGHPACSGDCMVPGIYIDGEPDTVGSWTMFGTNTTDASNKNGAMNYQSASTGPDHGALYAGKDFYDPSTKRRLFNSWAQTSPNNTMSMYRNLLWHTELQQILTQPAQEYDMLREQQILKKSNVTIAADGTPVRLYSALDNALVALSPDAGRYAELEVTFALPKTAVNLSVMVFANPESFNRSGFDGIENVVHYTPPPVRFHSHKTYYEVTAGCLDCWREGQGNGKPWKAGPHLFPLRMLVTDTNVTIRSYMDGGFAETYWMGGRAAQTINTLNDTEADWTGSVQKSAMYVRAQSADVGESVRILSAVAYSIGQIWVTPEEVLAKPPPSRLVSE